MTAIRNHIIGLVLNLITALVLVSTAVYGAGILNGKISETERAIQRHEEYISDIRSDLKCIMQTVSRIEGKLDEKKDK